MSTPPLALILQQSKRRRITLSVLARLTSRKLECQTSEPPFHLRERSFPQPATVLEFHDDPFPERRRPRPCRPGACLPGRHGPGRRPGDRVAGDRAGRHGHDQGRAADPAEDPRSGADARLQHPQSRLSDLRHAVLDGRQVGAAAADGRHLDGVARQADLHLQAARRPEVPRWHAGDLRGRDRLAAPLERARPDGRTPDGLDRDPDRDRRLDLRLQAEAPLRPDDRDARQAGLAGAFHHAEADRLGARFAGDHRGDRLRPLQVRGRRLPARRQVHLPEEHRLRAAQGDGERLRRRQDRDGRPDRGGLDPRRADRRAGPAHRRGRLRRGRAARPDVAARGRQGHHRQVVRQAHRHVHPQDELAAAAVQRRQGAPRRARRPASGRLPSGAVRRPEGLPALRLGTVLRIAVRDRGFRAAHQGARPQQGQGAAQGERLQGREGGHPPPDRHPGAGGHGLGHQPGAALDRHERRGAVDGLQHHAGAADEEGPDRQGRLEPHPFAVELARPAEPGDQPESRRARRDRLRRMVEERGDGAAARPVRARVGPGQEGGTRQGDPEAQLRPGVLRAARQLLQVQGLRREDGEHGEAPLPLFWQAKR